jgi:hypothetical protein
MRIPTNPPFAKMPYVDTVLKVKRKNQIACHNLGQKEAVFSERHKQGEVIFS